MGRQTEYPGKTGLRTIALALLATLSNSCGLVSQDTSSLADEGGYNGNIRISLTHPFDVQKDDFELLFAANVDALNVGLCVARETPNCAPGGAGFYPADLVYSNGTKNFFKSKSSALLEDGLVIKVIATDATGKTLDSRNIQFSKIGAPAAPAAATTATATTTVPPATTTTVPPATTTVPPANTGNPGGTGGGW